MACAPEEKETENESDSPTYLFSIFYHNAAWFEQTKGLYIDSNFTLYSFEVTDDNLHSLTTIVSDNTDDDLKTIFEQKKTFITSIPKEIVEEYYSKVISSSEVEFNDPVYGCADFGIIQYVAFEYSKNEDTYTGHLIHQSDDQIIEKMDEDAKETRIWLNLFVEEFDIPLNIYNCTGRDDVEERIEQKTELNEIIQLLVEDKSCSDSSQCMSIAYGSKPCGGPWSYLIYSTENTDTEQLSRNVEIYNNLEDTINRWEGISSDCSFVMEPATECLDNECVAIN